MASLSSLTARLPGRAAAKVSAPATITVDKAKFKGTLIAKGLTKSYKGRKVVSGRCRTAKSQATALRVRVPMWSTRWRSRFHGASP